MFRKTVVVAIAVGIVGVLALPISAAANWKHHNTSIQADTTIGLTGNLKFQGGLGGVECQVTSRVKLYTEWVLLQTTGTAETFVPHPTSDTTNCKGHGGLTFCQIHNLSPQMPNWWIHTVQTPASISVTTTTIHSQATGGFCPVTTISLTAGTVTLTPNQPNTAISATLAGALQAHLTTSSGTVDRETVTTTGTLSIESPNAHTYSI